MVVFAVSLKVIPQSEDPLREQRNLNLRRASISLVRSVLTDRIGLDFLSQSHCFCFSSTS
jgi:hypothetical protein